MTRRRVARSRKSTAEPKPTPGNRILDAVHETALELHAAGFIDKRRMRKYEALCLDPLPQYSSDRIRKLRDRHRVSQAVLAAILNTSLSTVRQWEIGEKRPSGPSVKLLNLLDRKGLQVLL
jgi:putative transcriptional regulator